MATAVILLIILAIKYMQAAPGEKADIKKSAVVYVIGAVILFGAVGIMETIKQFSASINNTVTGITSGEEVSL